MGFWSRLPGRKPPPPAAPNDPAAAPRGPFGDRPEVRRVLYYFEHNALREAVFHGHSALTEALTTGRITGTGARYLWAKATAIAMTTNAIPAPLLSDQAFLSEGCALLETIAISLHRHNAALAFVLTMPPPRHSVEAYYIAVVAREDELAAQEDASDWKPRYFTLELSSSPPPMLCEWTSQGGHVNHGDCSATDVNGFAQAVLALAAAPSQ